ncbi:hypothetical protein BU16DRAFT_138286 [Lophium mytilinum]|uniref:Uncharacterized protein n=1 Tax=Lophium mytilinum TaxID=390894 RepID=A0A6A6QFN0_9PEZI|nr:hypothetical protein BU16DRAFT_138286 [Lophium mytilinum]
MLPRAKALAPRSSSPSHRYSCPFKSFFFLAGTLREGQALGWRRSFAYYGYGARKAPSPTRAPESAVSLHCDGERNCRSVMRPSHRIYLSTNACMCPSLRSGFATKPRTSLHLGLCGSGNDHLDMAGTQIVLLPAPPLLPPPSAQTLSKRALRSRGSESSHAIVRHKR